MVFAMTLEEKKILQAMTPAQRVVAAMRLYASARRLKAAAVRSFHPEWTESQVADEVRKSFAHAGR